MGEAEADGTLVALQTVRCSVCGVSAEETEWAAYQVTYTKDKRCILNKEPVRDACADCKQTMVEGYAPAKKEWADMLKEFAENPTQKATFLQWVARRRGKASSFEKQGVSTHTRVGCRWEETRVPMKVSELQARFPGMHMKDLPVRVETIKDVDGTPTDVVLTRDPTEKPRLVLYCETESELVRHALQPERMLRPNQGEEFWRHVLQTTLRCRPSGAVPTAAELEEMLHPASMCSTCPNNHAEESETASATAGSSYTRAVVEIGDEDQPAGLNGMPGSSGGMPPACSGGMPPAGSGGMPPAGSGMLGMPPASGGMPPAGPASGGMPPGLPELTPEETTAAMPKSSRRGRHLFPQRSNPKDPAGKKRLRKSSCGSQPPGAAITVEDFLAGRVAKPKVHLYHMKQRLPALAKTADSLAVLAEQNRYTVLVAAERLSPGEVHSLPEDELASCLEIVLKELPAEKLPPQTALGLVRRRCALQVRNPAVFFNTCWPWSSDSCADDNSCAFDPLSPCMKKATAGLEDKVNAMRHHVTQEFLAVHMPRQTQGIPALLEFYDLVRKSHDPQGLSPAVAQMVSEVRSTLSGIAAIIQNSPVTSEQVEALLALKNAKGQTNQDIAILLKDSWWDRQMKQVWATATAESIAAPTLERLKQAALAGCQGSAVKEEEHSREAWETAMAKYTAWCGELREGATDAVMEALLAHAHTAVASLCEGAESTPVWLSAAAAWRRRLTWFQSTPHGQAAQAVPGQLDKLSMKLQAMTGVTKMQEALTWLKEGPHEGEYLEGVAAAFEDCRGLTADAAATEKILKALSDLDKLPMTHQVVTAALAMLGVVEEDRCPGCPLTDDGGSGGMPPASSGGMPPASSGGMPPASTPDSSGGMPPASTPDSSGGLHSAAAWRARFMRAQQCMALDDTSAVLPVPDTGSTNSLLAEVHRSAAQVLASWRHNLHVLRRVGGAGRRGSNHPQGLAG